MVPEGVEVTPLLMLHGWPGSIREFYEAIPLVTACNEERGFAVEVVVPSLPGFGFSSGAVRPGLGAAEMAVVLRNLMHKLGHNKFYIQGGDWGAHIGNSMVTQFPNEVFGYTADTVGVGLGDSPSGLLAYILQIVSMASRSDFKYRDDGGIDTLYSRDTMIDNLMVYWVNNAATTASRIYAESFNVRNVNQVLFAVSTSVPTWTVHAKNELLYQSPEMLKYKYTNLLNSTNLDDGGHFFAMEMPEFFSESVLGAISAFRSWHAEKKTCRDEL